ncbi:MAG: membrane protein insertase YidC [Oscillospiraceae bacterium]|nr:membrane protein insertase YidC [Oscillospiraceae bacterium]
MGIIDLIFGTFFGFIMYFCYVITGNFGWAIVVFTVIARIVLFPIALISQKNSIIMVKIRPELADLQARYEGETDTLIKEQRALYKREKYSTLKALLPLLLQIPIIIGVISVVNNPARHLGDDVNRFFFGADMFALPENFLIPALAILSTLLLCIVQNKYNVISREQGFIGKWGVSVFLVIFTGWFVFVVPSGVGLYWTYSNAAGIIVLAICNMIYNPAKFIDYENRSVKHRKTADEKKADRLKRKQEKEREKTDMQRFFSEEKELVFYSEASGFYKYFSFFIDYILDNSDITVHYLTSDINDQIFKINKPRFKSYFCSAHGMITAFMKMDCGILAMSMPSLETYQYKRSIVKKDIEYIYIEHGIGSYHLTHRKGAVDHYDTIFCYSKNNNEEIRNSEQVYGLPEKKLVNVGFGLLDLLIKNYAVMDKKTKEKPQILIAPSWQINNILEYCLPPLLEDLFAMDVNVIIRPHPEFIKRFPGKMKALNEKYSTYIGSNLEIETDFSSNETVFTSDLIITDWSSIAQEFSFTTKKPSLYINTPMKVMNPEWKKINVEPMEIWIRNKIGIAVEPEELGDTQNIVRELLDNSDKYKTAIEEIISEYMYNTGNAAETGGKYIIDEIIKRRNLRSE